MSATRLIEGFAKAEFTPGELLEACRERISRLNPSINALTSFCTERAIAEASRSTQRWREGAPMGPLDGLPIGVKDLQDAEGLPTTQGNPLFRSNMAKRDAPMVARLRRAGAIVLAKTNVPEFGAGGNTRNPVWGATGNPYDPRLTAGGSSGGSAAALAASLVPLCTGSDTGGSLRLPAAFCGVLGYRPSADVVAHPTRPVGWSVISVLGPMARNMDDLLLMLQTIHGFEAGDPLSSPADPARFDNLSPVSLDQLHICFSEDFGGAPVDRRVRSAFRERVAAIAPHVASCRPVYLDLGEMDRCFDILRAESFVAAFDLTGDGAVEQFGPHVAANVELGRRLSFHDRAWAHLEQTRILRAFNKRMADFDILLLPTAPIPAFPWEQSYPEEIDGQKMDIYYRWLALTYRGSLMGGPAITLPAGTLNDGLPFGLQLLGPLRDDRALLRAARAIEALLARDPAMAPVKPDLTKIVPPPVDLRGIATHPLESSSAGTARPDPVGTAV
ncbi:amidase [Chelativorans salis]|uniref:Amidase n=1 Tax=Chelativorans salis TaxID=2978478 RepID=A0ABT2LZ44_9HYPH|nr:amidase [Chelativorans sp. EGI FJ00035]MCT7378663.1 amidase [Chelativorans sp. EGI FJ00035]